MAPADAQVFRGWWRRQRGPVVHRVVRVADELRSGGPVGVVHVHGVTAERHRRVEGVRIARAHELQPPHEVLRGFSVAEDAPALAVKGVHHVAVFEHAEPRFPRLVETHPGKLVIQTSLQIAVTSALRRHGAIDVTRAVPRRCDVGHRGRQHELHGGGHFVHRGLGPVKEEQHFTGFREPLGPVFDGVLVGRCVRGACETHGARLGRPEECRYRAGGRVEGQGFRILLNEVFDPDGHPSRAIKDIDPALGTFSAIDDPHSTRHRRLEPLGGAQARACRRIRDRRNPVGLRAKLDQAGRARRHERHAPVAR